ncbi:MAG: glycosyltransferase family 1 protein [Balneolaceae bacterium]|nr:MAG: glycosyltransferase family 1 protein [Balneolaceae bacterium]
MEKPPGKKLLLVVNVDWFFLSHRLPIAQAAKEAGFDVTIAAADTGLSYKITDAGLRFVNLPFLEKKQPFFSELRMIGRLKNLYKNLQPDIVHHVTIRPVLYGSIAARLAGVPVLINALSGLGYVYTGNSTKNKLLRLILHIMLRTGLKHKNSALILQNRDDIELFRERNIVQQVQIELIRGSGVNTDLYKPMVAEEKRGKAQVALVGRMLRDKGVIEFIEAAKTLLEKGVNADFHLYGAPYASNPTSISAHEMKTLTEPKGIHYHGAVENIAEELNKIDIVCLPSYREGLPKSLLEAASAGKPVVATNVPGCREIVEVGKNGYLVEPRNSDDLAEKLELLILNPELHGKFGQYGRRKVLSEFSEEIIVEQTLGLYSKLMSEI